jgi:hypothetical protein
MNTSQNSTFPSLLLSFRRPASSIMDHNNRNKRTSFASSIDAPARNNKRLRSESNCSEAGTTVNKKQRTESASTTARKFSEHPFNTNLSIKRSRTVACTNPTSPHRGQPYPFSRLPFDIRYLIWMESMGPIMRIVPLDKFEKVHRVCKPQETVRKCQECGLILPGPAILDK